MSEAFSSVKAKAFRIARKLSHEHGVAIRKFRQIAGYESQLGPEWVAFSTDGEDFVSVHFPIGDDEERDAYENSAITRKIGNPERLVAISGSAFRRSK